MEITGKTITVQYNEKTLRVCNQTSHDWTHMYNNPAFPSEANDDLHTAGCGIFATAHMIDYLTGKKIDVEELADFAMAEGGRGDDGTDRPALLTAMQKAGRLTEVGLRYDFDGMINDHDALWENMITGGMALTDLRPGHIVALVDHRVAEGEKQLLVIDSWRDSIHPLVWEDVRGVVEGSEVMTEYVTKSGVRVGTDVHYAMYWVPLSKPFDFNLLHRVQADA